MYPPSLPPLHPSTPLGRNCGGENDEKVDGVAIGYFPFSPVTITIISALAVSINVSFFVIITVTVTNEIEERNEGE